MNEELRDNPPQKPLHIFVFSVLVIRFILWFPAQFLLRFLLRMEVVGRKNIENVSNGRVIFVANHSNEMDPYAFQYALPFFSKFVPLYFVSLPSKYYPSTQYGLRSLLYGGLFFRLMGAYPVYKGLNDFGKALMNHFAILEKNHPVLIFPEGAMNKDGDIGPARPGFIYLAKKTHATIVPVRIEGTAGLSPKAVFSRKRKIKITFGEPIGCEELKGGSEMLAEEEMWHLADDVMKKVKVL